MATTTGASHSQEVDAGERFAFGDNWTRFLEVLDETRISQAEASLKRALRVESLAGVTFLDAGSGSGLFSLAARRLGARVHSFDYDPDSVACTAELRRRYFNADPDWIVESGSVLDREYLGSLGLFDVVYSWGVLHHTGSMWAALGNTGGLVAPDGKLMIAIYNDQGTRSERWRRVKSTYNWLPGPLRLPMLCPFFVGLYWKPVLRGLLNGNPFRFAKEYGNLRGMTVWRDLVDWVGGYPFEVAKPEELFDYYFDRGFRLLRMRTTNSLGCNEMVFRRDIRPENNPCQ
jgi:SAM-dependent methyltransferase